MLIDFLKGLKTVRRPTHLIVRLSPREKLKIKVNAMMFADGCVSKWIRYSSIMLLPPPNHIKIGSVSDEDYQVQRLDCTMTQEQIDKIQQEMEIIEANERKGK
jgi:hypothetical protein